MIGAPITSKSLSSSLSLIASSFDCLKRNVVDAILASGCLNYMISLKRKIQINYLNMKKAVIC